jgi:hypothetical protein
MIRFVLNLFGLLFIQAALMGHCHSGSGDMFTRFGDGLRDAVAFDTGLVRRIENLFRGTGG